MDNWLSENVQDSRTNCQLHHESYGKLKIELTAGEKIQSEVKFQKASSREIHFCLYYF